MGSKLPAVRCENRARVGWMGSANTTSVLRRPLPQHSYSHSFLTKGTIQRYLKHELVVPTTTSRHRGLGFNSAADSSFQDLLLLKIAARQSNEL